MASVLAVLLREGGMGWGRAQSRALASHGLRRKLGGHRESAGERRGVLMLLVVFARLWRAPMRDSHFSVDELLLSSARPSVLAAFHGARADVVVGILYGSILGSRVAEKDR